MYARVFVIILQIFIIPVSLKTILYIGWFRVKRFKVSFLTCFLLAGLPLIGIGFYHVPFFISWAAGIGLAAYTLSKNSEVGIFPWGIGSIVGVEVLYASVERFIMTPVFF